MPPPLILLGTLQLSYWEGKLNLPHLPEIHSRLKKNNNKKVRCPKTKLRWSMHHCLLTESLPQRPYLKITHQQLSSVRAQCGADQQPCRGSTSRYLNDSFLLIGRAERCTVQLLGKNCFLVTGCGVIWQRNGFLLMAVLVLLCSIRIRWVQCALNFFFFNFILFLNFTILY